MLSLASVVTFTSSLLASACSPRDLLTGITSSHTLEEIAVAFGDQAFASGNEEVMVTADLKGSIHHEKSAH